LPTAPERKKRCCLVDKLGNRCSNEALSDLACLKHTREIADEWQRVIAETVASAPQLQVQGIAPDFTRPRSRCHEFECGVNRWCAICQQPQQASVHRDVRIPTELPPN
jgi:hypothetical protein